MAREPEAPVVPPEGGKRTALIEALRRALGHRQEVRLAMLFGSRARGCARPESDVDVAVEAPGVDLWTLAADLSQAVGLEVDVVDLRRAGYPLLKSVLRDGLVVHQGQQVAQTKVLRMLLRAFHPQVFSLHGIQDL